MAIASAAALPYTRRHNNMALLAVILKICKVLAVATLAAGAVGTVASRNYEDRKRFAYTMAGPGFGLCWAIGVGLTHVNGVPLFSTWIVGSMLLSMISLNAILYLAGKEERRGTVPALLVIAPLVGTVVLMVARPS
jgi:hypothetical protein